MAVVELDPFFAKALKLLQSRSKESAESLKQMLVEALAIKKVKTDLTVFAKVRAGPTILEKGFTGCPLEL